jgi:hypothetical protein
MFFIIMFIVYIVVESKNDELMFKVHKLLGLASDENSFDVKDIQKYTRSRKSLSNLSLVSEDNHYQLR